MPSPAALTSSSVDVEPETDPGADLRRGSARTVDTYQTHRAHRSR